MQRTISVDIRYVLWCIDKLAGAGHLVNEMTLVQRKAPEEPKAQMAVPSEPATIVAPARGTVKSPKK